MKALLQFQRNQYAVLISVCIAVFLINVDYTVINLALVTITQNLHSTLDTSRWTLSAYVLTWGAFILLGGWLSNIIQDKHLYIIGLTIFTFASLIGGLANNMEILIFSRILQGAGAALFVPAIYVLLAQGFSQQDQGFILGLLGTSVGIGLAIGPSLGGILLEYLSWHWIFYINVPFGVIAIFLSKNLVSPLKKNNIKFDKFSLFGVMLVPFIIYEIVILLNYYNFIPSMHNILHYLCLVFSIVIFLILQKYKKIIDWSLFKNKYFSCSVITYGLFQFSFASIFILESLYLQTIKFFSSYNAGLILLAITIAWGIISVISGKLSDKCSIKLLILGGLLILGVGVLVVSQLTRQSSISLIIISYGLLGTGLGTVFPLLNNLLIKYVEESRLSEAAAIFTMTGLIGNALGVSIGTSAIQFFIKIKANQLLTPGQLTEFTKFMLADKDFLTNSPMIIKSSFDNTLIMQIISHGLSNSLIITFTIIILTCIINVKMLKN